MSRVAKLVSWIGMVCAVFLLGAHALRWDRIRVDWITLALIGILVAIPLLESVRRIKIGQIEAEIDPREVAEVRAITAEEIGPTEDDPGPEPELYASILDLVHQEAPLGLAKLRIELEQLLKSLYSLAEPELAGRRLSSKRLIEGVISEGVIPAEWGAPLREVLSLSGRALHGEFIRPEDAEDLAMAGVRLLGELRDVYNEKIASPLEIHTIDGKAVEGLRSARYRVTTVLPDDDQPEMRTYALSREALDDFLDGYDDRAEFLVTIERMEEFKEPSAGPVPIRQMAP